MSLKHLILSTSVATASMAITAMPAQAQDAYLATIETTATNFCRRGTAEANGALLAISQNTALFSLIGTIYGGDGRTTFALPDLRGRMAIGRGQGPGLSSYSLGQRGGTETNTMTVSQMPAHTHRMTLQTSNAVADTIDPRSASFGRTATNAYVGPGTPPSGRLMNLDIGISENQGGSQAQNNMQPYLTMTQCIVTQGIFPSRN